MTVSIPLSGPELAAVVELSRRLCASPASVVKATIQNALGVGFDSDSLNYRLMDAANELTIEPDWHDTERGESTFVDQTSAVIETHDVAALLGLSQLTVQRRARKVGDPIRLARCRNGRKRPIQFERSKIESLLRSTAS